jgi:hypothetical protein
MNNPLINPAFDPTSRFASQILGIPTPGYAYQVAPGDMLQALLLRAYGQGGAAFQSPFMNFNSQLGGPDLSSAIGQLLYFPMLAQLQQAQQLQAAGLPIGNSNVLEALMARAGYQSPASRFFQSGGQTPPTNDELQAMIAYAMATGNVPTAVGPNGIVNQNGTRLSWGDLERGAREAIGEGRTRFPRTQRPTDMEVAGALGEDWRPRASHPDKSGVVPMSQLDYHEQLGNGGESIRQAGCYMTAMSMAATKITGDTSLNPHEANRRIRACGGYSGSSLVVDNAARGLGMKVVGRHAINQSNARQSIQQISDSIDSGRPVVAGVHYKEGSSSQVSDANHFITITQNNHDGTFTAIDPAGGHNMTLVAGSDGILRGTTPSGKHYEVHELTLLDARGGSRPNTVNV